MFAQVFSLPLSQGSVGNMLERSAQKCAGIYGLIKQEIANSSVVGADETGAKVNGQKWWIWVWQNVQNTFIVASDNRGSKTIESIWQDGLPNATLISDRWASQLKATVKNNQLCLAHLLRELIFLEESEKHLFSTVLKELLLSVFKAKKEMKTAYGLMSPEAIKLEEELNQALSQIVYEDQNPKTAIFQRSIIKYRNYILPCLYDIEIPPDNNGSERAIRKIKPGPAGAVKQKVSGQFKTGQNAFCTIRSVIDTLIKRQVELLPCLNQIIKLQPV
jgi:transposase